MADDFEPLVGLLRLLSDRTRLSIVMTLVRGERNVSSLCDELHLPQPTVSHHLGLLRSGNLIANRRVGKQVFYGLNINLADDGAMSFDASRYKVRIGHVPAKV